MPITDISQLDLNKVYNYSDYLSWNLKERVELIKGKIFRMSPAPGTNHQLIATNLSGLIWSHFRTKPCKVFEAPFDVRLDIPKGDKPFTVVQPDLCVICDESKLDERGCNGAPDLVVEILSPGNTQKEMREKFEVYEEAGVREYWLVEPNDKAIFAYVLDDQGAYRGLRPKTETETIQASIFPDLEIEIAELFV
jgi:Uma2 family endonuclease